MFLETRKQRLLTKYWPVLHSITVPYYTADDRLGVFLWFSSPWVLISRVPLSPFVFRGSFFNTIFYFTNSLYGNLIHSPRFQNPSLCWRLQFQIPAHIPNRLGGRLHQDCLQTLAIDGFIWKRAVLKKVCFLIRDVIVHNRKKIRNYRKREEKSIQNIITQK